MTVREIEAKYGLIKDCISSLDLLSSEEKLELIMNCVFGKGRRKNCYSIFIIEHLYDADEFCVDAAELCRVSLQTVKGAYWTRRRRLFTANNALALSGAEAVSIVLRSLGCRFAVAYPGTSELSLCEAINRCPGFELINGRGDTESAFCTAGANLVDDGKCICILHMVRGGLRMHWEHWLIQDATKLAA